MNLGIGNMDFEDYIEDEDGTAPESGSQPDLVKFDPEPGEEEEPPAQPNTRETEGGEEHKHFGVYGAIYRANVLRAGDLLEPGRMQKHPKNAIFVGVGGYGREEDPLRLIVQKHPWQCVQKKQIHRQWIVCVDNTDPAKEGVLLVYIDWDGSIDRESGELVEIGRNANSSTERAPVQNTLSSLLAK